MLARCENVNPVSVLRAIASHRMRNPIDHLLFYARYQPDACAVAWIGGQLSFADLLARVRAAAGRLRALNLAPGAIVATHIADRPTDWIMTLALMHEALPSCSFASLQPLVLPPALQPALVLSDRALDPAAVSAAPQLLLDPSWIDPAAAGAIAPRSFATDDALLRLTLTSGTTGVSRAVPGTLRARVGRASEQVARTRWGHVLCLMALGSTGGYNCALQALREGMPAYLAAGPHDALDLIERHRIESLFASPTQLASLLPVLRERTRLPTCLHEISYAGASASRRLLDDLRAWLCPRVELIYGSTEVGTVARLLVHQHGIPEGAAGHLLPGVQAEVVDAQHRPLPHGEEGVLRLRTACMAHGYLGADTDPAFRDGWFYPGDLAVLRDDGLLLLRGRVVEVLNRGGVKIDPARVDDAALDHAAIVDAAAFVFENADGVDDLALALVAAEGFEFDALQRHLRQALAPDLLPRCYLRVREIPRNAMGKVQRARVRDAYGAQAREATRATRP